MGAVEPGDPVNVRRGGRSADVMDCARVEELAPELALGLLDGAERAAVLAHVDRCAACRAEVASLTEMGDHLLQLAPEVPPPPGFESRVLTQLAPAQRQLQRRRRKRRTVLAVAAVVLAVVGAVALTLALGAGDGDGGDQTATPGGPGTTTTTTSPVAATAELHNSEGAVVGEAVLHRAEGPRDTASIDLDLAAWLGQMAPYGEAIQGAWWLHVEGPGGLHEMHALTLDDMSDTGTVRVPLDTPSGDVGSVAIVDDSGRAWCWGDFA